MRTSSPFLAAVAVVPFLAAPAWADVLKSETRPVAAFRAVSVSGSVKLTVRRGEPSLVITADDRLLGAYRTEVRGERLVIEPTERTLRHSERISIVATTPRLDEVDASGGVEVLLESVTDTALALDLSGGAEVRAPGLALDTLTVDASGGVTAVLEGRARKATYDASGGVQLDASKLASQDVVVSASGGCTLKVRASGSITGEASGGVDVRVAGNPPKSRVRTSGGASVRSLKD